MRDESKLVLWRLGDYSRLLSLGLGLNLFCGHISEVGTATVLSATGELYIHLDFAKAPLSPFFKMGHSFLGTLNLSGQSP